MAVRIGEYQGGIVGTSFEISSSKGTIQQNNMSGAVPSSEPGTYPVSFTVASDNLPTVSPTPLSFNYAALVVIAIQHTGSSSSYSLYYKFKVNGETIYSYENAAQYMIQNAYYTLYGFLANVSLGDVVTGAIWTSSTSTFKCNVLLLHPTKLKFWLPETNNELFLLRLETDSADDCWPDISDITVGNPGDAGYGGSAYYPSNGRIAYPQCAFSMTTSTLINTPYNGVYEKLCEYSTEFDGLIRSIFDISTYQMPVSSMTYYPYLSMYWRFANYDVTRVRRIYLPPF